MTIDPFDEKAASWDSDPAKVQRAAEVGAAIAAAISLDSSTRLLEYGAGTGLVTQALNSSVGPVTLADTSTGMRDVIKAKIDAGAISNARVWDLDLATQPAPDEQFELIVTVLTMHHISDLTPVLAGFADLLVPGGHLCIADLDKEDGSFHGDGFGGHHGFDRDGLAAQLGEAGFTSINYTDCAPLVRDAVPYPMFLVICSR